MMPEQFTEEQAAREYKRVLLTETREELQKADAKASLLLAAAGLALGALLTGFTASRWSPAKLVSSSAEALAWAAIVLGILGLFLLGAAVKPKLRRSSQSSREDLFYFGHVAAYAGHWLWSTSMTCPAEFDAALEAAATNAGTDRRLEDQIWFLGCSAYRKYKLIAGSMWIFTAALICGVVAIVFEVWR